MKQIIVNNISTSYFITEDGQCYNNNTGKYLKGQINYKNGYKSYSLTMPDGSKKRCYAHRLVALAYLPHPPGKEQVNHIDGNKENNCVDNLEWVNGAENQQHALARELRKFEHVFCFNRERQLVAEYKNIPEASQACSVSETIIGQELRKEIKTLSGGFYWSRERDLGPVKNYINTGKAKKVNQYDLKGKYIMSYNSTGIAARAIGGNPSHIGECCRGKIKSYKGFIWRYVEDIVSTSNESWRECGEHS